MKVTIIPATGTSAKFTVSVQKRGEFMISLSRTLYETKWGITTPEAQLEAVTRMATAIVGRHDPQLPFKDKYIFGDHNTEATLDAMVKYLQKVQL
jgi:hypothetical protein